MRCIVKDHETEAGNEHIIPGAFGGRLTTPRVCDPCNHGPCSKLDAILTDDWFLMHARIRYRVPGWEAAASRLYGNATTTDGLHLKTRTDLRGSSSFKSLGKEPRVEVNGRGSVTVTLYPRVGSTPSSVLKSANKYAERYGLPLPTIEQVEAVLKSTRRGPIQITFSVRMKLNALAKAGAKIAYEFAAQTLSESYLDDEGATSFRRTITSANDETKRFNHGILTFAHSPGAHFNAPELPGSTHVLRLMHEGDALRVRIRLFDVYEGAYCVTPNPNRFLKPGEGRIYTYDVATKAKDDYRFRTKVNPS